MISFETIIKKFEKQGEKTGWTYILIPAAIAEKINPGCKKTFRVKGKFDALAFDAMTLLPMGEGDFIIPLKADVRKAIGKRAGDKLNVQLALQSKAYEIAADFMDCLEDEPKALEHFQSLTGSHRNYFSKWIESAKTEETRTKRIVLAVNALARKMGYPEMIREQTAKNKLLR
ncbi:MAG: YdeI/OmpD-associated family protein [Lacibacter sp.]